MVIVISSLLGAVVVVRVGGMSNEDFMNCMLGESFAGRVAMSVSDGKIGV